MKAQYSKIIISLMIIFWFIGGFFGIFVVCYQLFQDAYSVSIDAVLNYVGIPMSCGIVGYLIKSAIENKQKIINALQEKVNKLEDTIINDDDPNNDSAINHVSNEEKIMEETEKEYNDVINTTNESLSDDSSSHSASYSSHNFQ